MKNQVQIKGILTDGFTEKHMKRGCVYESKVLIMRQSGVGDCVPIMASGDVDQLDQGMFIEANGEILNNEAGICIHANEIKASDYGFENDVEVEGRVCSRIKHLLSPQGRLVSDVLIYSGDKYIPCVIEGREMAGMGSGITVKGKIQSREYKKGDEICTAIEVVADKYCILS